MQSDLDDVTQWLCSSQLCLNVAKSTSMLIGSCQRIRIVNKVINVSVGGTLLTTASSVCYLGITIDPTLMEFACFLCGVQSFLSLGLGHYHR